MATPDLTKIAFTPGLLSSQSVQRFDCGSNPWEQAINDWLKSPPGSGGACDDVAIAENLVWLYVTREDGAIVGIGSIGPSAASWPKNSSPRIGASCITQFAVDSRHRGKGFGKAIFEDLLSVAKGRIDKFPLVVLYVDQENPAISFYESVYNFVKIGKTYSDPKSGRPHLRMAVKLEK